jgi:hypothetical protein
MKEKSMKERGEDMDMESFSQRKGIKPVKKVIQVDSMDEDLRNGLWNALTVFYWKNVTDILICNCDEIFSLCNKIWLDFFKIPLDTLHNHWDPVYKKIRKRFFDSQWYEVYDFIEFVANNYRGNNLNTDFMNYCNCILERELSGYRFVAGKITQITSEIEVSEIEDAFQNSEPFKAVNTHLKKSLDLFSDRKSPDYRNSIKESISAVEAICNLITKEKKATLGQALEKLETAIPLHSALKKGFSSLYGYTSDAEGIRHALLDEPQLSFEDAKFMLVACSAFVNYLIAKASKSGNKI